uniref:Palmitoyl-protein thioesterase 1 n=1 Tax=Rhabditophanes sp. KR3021 TaxID=114890 RepID=A0AC35TGK0_9BILA
MRCFGHILICFVFVCSTFCRHHNTINSEQNYKNVSLPIVLWHGMGDSCCNPLSMGSVKRLLEDTLKGVYVHSLELGDNVVSDTEHGFFANMNEIVDMACQKIKADAELQNGYNSIGFSQGGLFVRALAQRCPFPKMNYLVSIGGPQQGIYGFPFCIGNSKACKIVSKLLNYGAYESFIQKSVVQAQYWHDPIRSDLYKNRSIFLADINNENKINVDYKENIEDLKGMILVKFLKDEMIVPRESSWFGFFGADGSTVSKMENTTLYLEDRIGLKALHESGRLHFLEVNGEHLRISGKELVDKIVIPYLK